MEKKFVLTKTYVQEIFSFSRLPEPFKLWIKFLTKNFFFLLKFDFLLCIVQTTIIADVCSQ